MKIRRLTSVNILLFRTLLLINVYLTHTKCDSGCPSDTVRIPDSINNQWRCFLLAIYPQQYVTAESICEGNGGYLTSVPNLFVNVFLAQVAKSAFGVSDSNAHFYIGVNNLFDGNWENIDGSIVNFTDWATGEPNSSTSTNGCVYVDLEGYWHNGNCFDELPYICEVPEINLTTIAPPTTPAPKCDSEWTLIENYCYKLFMTDSTEIADSETGCLKAGSKIASIHDRETALDIGAKLVTIDNPNPVIGLCSNFYTGADPIQFKWLDESPLDFVYWEADQPSTSSNVALYCATIDMEGRWSTFDATKSFNSYICRKSSLSS